MTPHEEAVFRRHLDAAIKGKGFLFTPKGIADAVDAAALAAVLELAREHDCQPNSASRIDQK